MKMRSYFVLLFSSVLLLNACSNDGPDTDAVRFFKRANLLLENGEYRQAINFYNEAIMKDSTFIDAISNRGISYFEIHDHKKALKDYNWALALNDSFIPARQNRMRLYLTTNRYREAFDDADFLVNEVPKNASFRNARAIIYQELGQQELALKDLDAAIALDPQVDYLVNRGYIYYVLYRYEEAETDLNQALRKEAYHPQALNNMALVLADKGEPTEGLSLVNRALTVQKDDKLLLNNKAYILLRERQTDEAEKILSQLNAVMEEQPWYQRNLAMLRLQQGRPKDAQALLEEAIISQPKIEHATYLLAKAHAALGNTKEACDFLQKAVSENDPHAKADNEMQCTDM